MVIVNRGCCSDLNRRRWHSGACSSLYLPLSESLSLLPLLVAVCRCLLSLVFSQRGRGRFASTLGVANCCCGVGTSCV
ncbi:unnamed protein product [Chondrus crispus]|uniref:Uncharacterized protein n=1 Tax=Chondrus crispus TaxID=2769 RepID=R7QJR7_CHOCR|nr:unnamed protein product [Chondrus crispus]CDF37655.1 unnamed protein product [Chondrus crispus]|eukprot:XP_005717526.1 unnamed protein product [Chondrus crispus]